MAKKSGNKFGAWAFLIGVILAIVFSFLDGGTTLAIILVVIGLIVGLLNVADKEVEPFLMASTVLIIASAFGTGVLGIIPIVGNMLNALLVLFVPATIIVAIKHVFTMAKN